MIQMGDIKENPWPCGTLRLKVSVVRSAISSRKNFEQHLINQFSRSPNYCISGFELLNQNTEKGKLQKLITLCKNRLTSKDIVAHLALWHIHFWQWILACVHAHTFSTSFRPNCLLHIVNQSKYSPGKASLLASELETIVNFYKNLFTHYASRISHIHMSIQEFRYSLKGFWYLWILFGSCPIFDRFEQSDFLHSLKSETWSGCCLFKVCSLLCIADSELSADLHTHLCIWTRKILTKKCLISENGFHIRESHKSTLF